MAQSSRLSRRETDIGMLAGGFRIHGKCMSELDSWLGAQEGNPAITGHFIGDIQFRAGQRPVAKCVIEMRMSIKKNLQKYIRVAGITKPDEGA